MSGQYVEARTAEIFTGGCIMGSEAETMGKQAVLAWKVDRGTVNGVSVDGLSVVAALAGDKNLGLHEIGGDRAVVRSVVYVDERANPVQRIALAASRTTSRRASARSSPVTPAPITFADAGQTIHVATQNVALDVNKVMTHDPTCGAMQWFHPLADDRPGDDGRGRRRTRSTARCSAPSGATRTSARRSSARSAAKSGWQGRTTPTGWPGNRPARFLLCPPLTLTGPDPLRVFVSS